MEHKDIYLDDDLDKKTRQVQSSLEAGAQAGEALAQALDKARAAAKALAVTSSQVKRVLSGFDQINRLGEKKKTSSSKKKSSAKTAQEETAVPEKTPAPEKQVTPQLQTIQAPSVPAVFLELIGIYDAVEFIKQVKRELNQLWQETLVPMGEWIGAVLVPAMGYYLVESVDKLWRALSAAREWIQNSWQGLYEKAVEIFTGIVERFVSAKESFTSFMNALLSGNLQLGSSSQTLGNLVGAAIAGMITAWNKLKTVWDVAVTSMKTVLQSLATVACSILQGILDFVSTGFTEGWKAAFAGLKAPVSGMINSIIGFLNKMLSGLTSALNGVINAANKLKFTVPDWVPGIGGKTYGFSLKTVTLPQIPYLAQGAVLPANQPFLAVVGDQKHGKNIEAPLATIQEAVAAVMADQTAGNMAGHEATVAVLRQILEAVLGLELSEAVIAGAGQSYQLKTAVMKGGGF